MGPICALRFCAIVAVVVLHVFVDVTTAQGTANTCWKPTLKKHFDEATGIYRIVYHVDAFPNQLTCVTIRVLHDGLKGGMALSYVSADGKRVEQRGRLKQDKQGRVIWTVGSKKLNVHIDQKLNGIIVFYVCNPPRGDQEIFLGYPDGKALFKEADAEAKIIAQIPNPYRVKHVNCTKVKKLVPGGKPAPPPAPKRSPALFSAPPPPPPGTFPAVPLPAILPPPSPEIEPAVEAVSPVRAAPPKRRRKGTRRPAPTGPGLEPRSLSLEVSTDPAPAPANPAPAADDAAKKETKSD